MVNASSINHPAPDHLDVAVGVDPRVEMAADHSRGLVLDDHGGAGNDRASGERGALMDRHFDEIGAVRVEHGTASRRRRAGTLRLGQRSAILLRYWAAQQQYPAQHLDLDPRDDPAIE